MTGRVASCQAAYRRPFLLACQDAFGPAFLDASRLAFLDASFLVDLAWVASAVPSPSLGVLRDDPCPDADPLVAELPSVQASLEAGRSQEEVDLAKDSGWGPLVRFVLELLVEGPPGLRPEALGE